MRQILHDHARARATAKRGGGARRVPMTVVETPMGTTSFDLIALDESLSRLDEIDQRDARILELRFFGGLTMGEIASIVERSKRSVEADGSMARSWLRRKLGDG